MRRTRLTPFLLFAVVFVVQSVSPTPQTGDSRLSAIAAWQLFTHGNLHLEGYPLVTGLAYQGDLLPVGGHLVPFFPWPPMLLALPGDLIAAALGHPPTGLSIASPSLVGFIEVPTASLLVALTTLVLWRVVLNLPYAWATRRTALIAALTFAFGTIAWSVGSRALWQQTVSMLLLALSLLVLQRLQRAGSRAPAWAALLGVVLMAAVAARPTNLIFAALVGLWMLVTQRPRTPFVLLGALVAATPFVLFSLNQYGTLVPPYYYVPTRLTDPPVYGFFESFALILVSPSRGLLFFVPVVLLAGLGVWLRIRSRQFTGLDAVLVVAIGAQVVLIAFYGSTGGFTYGPRLLMDVVPFIVYLALPAIGLLGRRAAPGGGRDAPGAAGRDALVEPAAGPEPSSRKPLTSRPPERRLVARRVLAGVVVLVLAWGLFVNATGGLMRAADCWNVTPALVDAQPERVWDWSDPQFLRPYRDLASGVALRQVVAGSCTA
ncbi:hypothetical protein [Subtercola sp. RTI3]|uniref:hypothetical protein n=1 Tax=Subtercola sp. RTI3 TaxID=3048639 RepID=UPI002B2295CE|nr:hypothetical protein [Subtercola sp. RTI3]MEA9985266.1 hypothetical protein [Subtercola sp. RTI3]